MKKMKKFERIDNKFKEKDSLNLGIYFNYSCNYNCYYCYAEKSNRIMSKENMQKLINFIIKYQKKHNKFIFIEIFGGEPFLYSYLFEFLDQIEKINNCFISLKTNFSLIKNEEIKKLNKYKNFELYLTIHSQYINEKYINRLIDLIKKLKCKIEINVALDKNYKNNIKMFIKNSLVLKILKEYNLNLTYSFIEYNNYINKPEDFIDLINFNKLNNNWKYYYNEKIYDYNGIFEILKNKYNFNYKNKVLCYNMSFSVDPDLIITHSCDNKKFTLKELENIDNMKIICPLNFCNYTCNFNIKKKFFK